MAETEAQKRAREKYEARTKKTYLIKLNKNTDADILEHLAGIENFNGYIKELIRADLRK